MNETLRNLLTAVVILPTLAIGLVVLGACGESAEGLEGNLTFNGGDWDMAEEGKDTVVFSERAVAVGASLTLTVWEEGKRVTLSRVEFEDKGIFEVKSMEGHEVVLEGLKPGATIMRVETTDGVTDGIPLTVAAFDHAELTQSPTWTRTCDADACFGASHPEVALVRGSLVVFDAIYLDPAGNELIGQGISKWSAEGAETSELPPRSLQVTLPAEGESFSLSYGQASETFPLVDADATTRIELAANSDGSVRDKEGVITVPVGAPVHLVALPFDAEGRLIVGGGANAEVVDGASLSPVLSVPEARTSVDRGDEARRVTVVAAEAGTVEVQVSFAGHVETMTVVVVP